MTSRLVHPVTIINRKGLHARASAKLAKLAATLPVKIILSCQGEEADARSIMELLSLGAGLGTTVTLSVSGDEADSALKAVIELFEDGFGELTEDQACSK